MIDEHDSKSLTGFKGLFARGTIDVVPLDHFADCLNLEFDVEEARTRKGYSLDTPFAFSILRSHPYEKSGEATRYLVLRGNNSIYDTTSPSTPILTISGMVDFSVLVLFDRAYITPHDGITGMPGQSVYVYEGTGVARLAGGLPGSVALNAVNSATVGNVEAGLHLFSYAYLTISGFITQPGPAFSLITTGGKSVDLSAIPIGPTGTIGRYILSTKIITDYNGNPDQQEFFFVPNGFIGNNVDTTLTVSFFDADLLASADYLRDQLSTIPAGIGLGVYGGRLISWGENANPSRIRVSKVNDPESHDSVAGYIDPYPKDNAGSTKVCVEFRTQLNIHKSFRSYVTSDNGNSPSLWPVNSLDASIGGEVFSVGRVLEIQGSTTDTYVLASRRGLMLFTGLFSDDLTSSVFDYWQRITKTAFNKVIVALDTINTRIYIALPLDNSTDCNFILYGDYSEGLTNDGIKWSPWNLSKSVADIFVDIVFSTKEATFKFSAIDGNLYKYNPAVTDDDGLAIDSFIQFPQVFFSKTGGMSLISGARMRITGNGNLQLYAYSLDNLISSTPPGFVLSPNPGTVKTREFLGMENEASSIKIRTSFISEFFSIRMMKVFGIETWPVRPSLS